MEVFPIDLQVLLAQIEMRAVLLTALVGAACLGTAAIVLGRPRGVAAVVALTLAASMLPWVVFEVVAGKPRPSDLAYLAARYGPKEAGGETEVKILHIWMTGEGKPIGMLIDRLDDDLEPEWIVVEWDAELAKRLRKLQAESRGAGKKTGKKMGIRMRIRARTDRDATKKGRGTRRSYERNWERRFDIRYELDWPEVPPPKSPEEGGITVG